LLSEKVKKLPSPSDTMQNPAVGHEIDLSSLFGSIVWGPDHRPLENVNALPFASTAMQDLAERQAASSKKTVGSMSSGLDHWPFS
jgi:hypothetical protein